MLLAVTVCNLFIWIFKITIIIESKRFFENGRYSGTFHFLISMMKNLTRFVKSRVAPEMKFSVQGY